MDRDARRQLAATPTSAAEARTFVRSVLEAWDCDDEDDVAALLTSEVVSNAVLHAATALALDLRLDEAAAALRVEVHDEDPRLPAPVPATSESVSGRGLHLVASLARRWGAELDADGAGKVVWFELPARRRPPVDR